MKHLHYLLLIAIITFSSCRTQQVEQRGERQKEGQSRIDISKMQGGMWVPSELEGVNETEMRILGSNMSVSDIYDTSKESLKDAVVHFNGGCTAEIISDQGLLLANHHCGFSAIQSHSSTENDYLKDGYWAQINQKNYPTQVWLLPL